MVAEIGQRFLALLDEPALLLTRSGTVRHANAPARQLLGHDGANTLVDRPLGALTADAPETLSALLRRFSGSGQAVLGSLQLRTRDGAIRKCRCRGGRLGGPGEEPLLLLRLEADASPDRFKLLTEKIVALNAEIRRSQQAQLQLEAMVAQKEMLLRELHHRVKNNLQALLGILLLAEQQAKVLEAKGAIHDARLRVEAMAMLQRLLYQKEELAHVSGATFLQALCAHLERAFHRPGILVRVIPAELAMPLDVASAMGLIVNELLTNAFKHAFPGQEDGEITVQLRRDGDGVLTLVVEDNGCGPGPMPTSGTGLLLVRGLAQQHGGTCTVESASGTRCVVTLRDGHPGRARALH
jgi:two-component sensor histidine kinase